MITLLARLFIKDRDRVQDAAVRRAYGMLCSLTGIGLKFSNAIISLSGSHLSLVLVMSMIASIILAWGCPRRPATSFFPSLRLP